jgi:ATP-dependent DNA helicase RecQ
LYFDDYNSPENCGHCSVCRGQVAKLTYSTNVDFPQDDFLIKALAEFKNHLSDKVAHELTIGIYSRFLAGISIPLFARNKVKKLSGFACCENLRFEEIQQKISKLHF